MFTTRFGRTSIAAIALLTAGACGGSKEAVRPDEMSAAQHRQEARSVTTAAEVHQGRYDPRGAEPLPPADANTASYDFSAGVYNPTEWHLAEAQRLRAHAAQHRKAAAQLEQFETAACKQFPPSTRAACPLLGPVTRIDDIPGGVRATFAAGTRVDAVLAHMQCHYAYAQSRGFGEAASCPLYVRGVEIRPARQAMAVDIVSSTPAVTDQIRARSREEAVYLHGRGP